MAYLASFEGVPTETAVHILNDDLLMGRLADVEATDAQFGELIESAVIQENSVLIETLSATTMQLTEAQLAAEAASKRAEEERIARESSETLARQIQEAAESEANRAVRELEGAKQKESVEAAARRAADQRSKVEAEEKAALLAELTQEREQRIAAELTATTSARRWATLWRVGAAVVAGVLILFVFAGPKWFGWDKFLARENHVAMQAIGSVIIAGLAYLAAGVRHKSLVGTTVIVGGVLTLLSLL